MKNKENKVMRDEEGALIDEWFTRNFHGWSGYETSIYNHAHAAKEELKKIFFNRVRQNDDTNTGE